MSGALFRSLLVFVGGGIGANVRYWLGLWILSRTSIAFPWSTFVINFTGSFLIGLIFGLLVNQPATHSWRVFLVVGCLGGYTTFSTFTIETVGLLRDRSFLYALGNLVGSPLAGLVACWLGLVATRAFAR